MNIFIAKIRETARQFLGIPAGPPPNPNRPKLQIGGELRISHPPPRYNDNCSIIVPKGAKLAIGKDVYIGRNVEIAPITEITIGDFTSIQDRCYILGDAHIGRYVSFAPNVYVSSGSHRFRDNPVQNIKDQDREAMSNVDLGISPPTLISRVVSIHDDCWIGINAAIMPAITIHKGAIIGANAVVTKDVGPYEIVGGVPARKIGHRIAFNPPPRIEWNVEEHEPYFYSGFLLSSDERKEAAKGHRTTGPFSIWLSDHSDAKSVIVKVRSMGATEPTISHNRTELRIGKNMQEIRFPRDKTNLISMFHVSDCQILEIEAAWLE